MQGKAMSTETKTIETATAGSPKWMVIVGWVLTVLPAAMLIMSGTMKLMGGPELEKGMEHSGYPLAVAKPLAIVEIGSTLVYLIPQTAVLGAILLTGYMGGAIATHVRLEEPFIIQTLIGVVVWLGIFLRDARLRQLIPLRQ
jgi:uncharacterized membrane protein YphA (DoxX/SURF4 family)